MRTKDACFETEARNPKIQIPNKPQTSKPQIHATQSALANLLGFGISWRLRFGASNRLFRQRIDSFGQTKIKLCQPAFAVRRDNEADFVVTNVDIGMVFFFLGHFRHGIYEIDRIRKIIKLKSALDMFLLQFPFWDLFHAIFKVRSFDQVSHNGTTSNTRKSFCNAKSSGFKNPESGEDF